MKLPNLKDAKIRTKNEIEFIDLEESYEKKLINKKFFIKTYGCQMNVHDSEEIKARLETLGLTETDTLENSDIVILNTCAIRENAHDKVFGFLGRCKYLKDTKKDLIIAVCGCMSQEESVVNEIIKNHPYINIVFGTHNIHELQKLILENNKKLDINVYSIEGKVYENTPYKRDSKIKGYVNIQYGCDKFCTFCIVPYTRGKQRSRRSERIIKEVEQLVKDGYQEVTLLGQNVNAYGKEIPGEISFGQLLEQTAKTGIPRVRFVTSHPWDFTDETIEIIAKYDNIMPQIHLPLQSGSSKILKIMGRKYKKEEYLTLFNKIKTTIPNVAITTDIIVAFPGETDEDFQDTLDVVNNCDYDGAFTFIYSPREDTPAAKMKNTLTEEVKNKRLQELNVIVNKHALANNKKLEGTIQKVLIEGLSGKDIKKVFGYTETLKLVNIEAPKELIGQIVDVKIIEAKSFSLKGQIV